ncbi:hypothetical protein OESDEN_09821 [Oesophagostomum dentatum]|uniref:Uncharacterized protein n=1 Tax=Oesophagostomum dentatum TaxID=61180 RepID=A0A0B1T3G0_OESDE|nr:hypothetical protein OESDEN_09821 [Oesophagostomum dentatum]
MIGLWNLCNIYSTVAVDTDAAMRKIRQTIRKRLDMKDSPQNSVSSFPLIDDYRPPTKKNEHQQEIYDKPTNKVRVCVHFCDLLERMIAIFASQLEAKPD